MPMVGNAPSLVLDYGGGESGAVVFLLPPIHGGMVGYSILASALRLRHRVLGLDYPTTINDLREGLLPALIDIYVERIRDRAADRPVYLIGWSMGAILAYECGRRLHEAGVPIAAAILIDPNPSESLVTIELPSDEAELTRFMWRSYLGFKFYPVELRQIVDDARFWELTHADRLSFVQARIATPRAPFLEFHRTVDLAWEFDFIESAILSLHELKLEPSRLPVEIVCCEQFREATQMAWPPALATNRRVTSIRGDHNSAVLNGSIRPILSIVDGGVDAAPGSGASIAHDPGRSR